MLVYGKLSLRDRISFQATYCVEYIVINPQLSQALSESCRTPNTNCEVSLSKQAHVNINTAAIMWFQDNTLLCHTCQCNNIEIAGMDSVDAPAYKLHPPID
jgi:hypothetical protein